MLHPASIEQDRKNRYVMHLFVAEKQLHVSGTQETRCVKGCALEEDAKGDRDFLLRRKTSPQEEAPKKEVTLHPLKRESEALPPHKGD
jgi:hypothetical protein